jgi:hypothetical protein
MDGHFTLCRYTIPGRTVTRAAIRRLPTATARLRTRSKSCWICGGHSGIGVHFLRVLRFALPLIHSTYFSTIISVIQG